MLLASVFSGQRAPAPCCGPERRGRQPLHAKQKCAVYARIPDADTWARASIASAPGVAGIQPAIGMTSCAYWSLGVGQSPSLGLLSRREIALPRAAATSLVSIMIDARADVDPAQRMAGRGGRSVGSLCANAGSSIANWAAGTGAAHEPGQWRHFARQHFCDRHDVHCGYHRQQPCFRLVRPAPPGPIGVPKKVRTV